MKMRCMNGYYQNDVVAYVLADLTDLRYSVLINISMASYYYCRGAVASFWDSYTDSPSSFPVRLVVASW